MTQDPDDDAGRWPVKLRVALLLVGVLIGAVAAPMIYAQVTTNDYQIGENATYVAPDGLEIEAGEDIETNRQQPFADNQTVDFGPEAEFSADGFAHARVSGLEDQWLVLDDLDVSSNELRVYPDDQSQVHVQGAATRLEVNSIALDDGNEDLRVTTSSSTTLDVWDLPADTVVLAVDADTGGLIETIETDSEGSGTFSVDQSRDVRFVSETTAPTISDVQPEDGATVGEYEIDLSATVSDDDFGEPWGDNVTVTFYDVDDGTEIHSESIGSAGTVNATWSGLDMGANTWNVTATDEYGNSASAGPRTVETPNELEIRDEVNQELINGSDVNVTVEFYPEESGGEIVQKTTDDGTLSLDGLPADQEYTISATAEGYHPRTTIIRDITDQQTVYMLPDNESVVETVDVEFILEDYSGQFDASDSRLLIQKPITTNGERTLQTVSADTFGAANSFVATLERDQRYVLIVENEEGIERPQGDYVATESRQAVLEVGTIEWSAEESAYSWRALYQNATGGAIVTFAFSDPQEATSDMEVVVRERTNESNVLHTETFDGPIGNASFTADVPPDQRNATLEVVWSADRDGGEIEGSRVVSGRIGDVENPLGGGWAILVVGTLLVFVSLIFGGATAGLGTVVVGGVAALLWWMGWLPAPALVVVGALIVAALFAGGDRV